MASHLEGPNQPHTSLRRRDTVTHGQGCSMESAYAVRSLGMDMLLARLSLTCLAESNMGRLASAAQPGTEVAAVVVVDFGPDACAGVGRPLL